MDWRHRARLSPRELAEVGGVCTRTIFREIAAGKLASVKSGRLRWIPIEDAPAWLGGEVPPAPPAEGSVDEAARSFLARGGLALAEAAAAARCAERAEIEQMARDFLARAAGGKPRGRARREPFQRRRSGST